MFDIANIAGAKQFSVEVSDLVSVDYNRFVPDESLFCSRTKPSSGHETTQQVLSLSFSLPLRSRFKIEAAVTGSFSVGFRSTLTTSYRREAREKRKDQERKIMDLNYLPGAG